MKPDPFCYLVQTGTERNPPHGWAVHFTGGEVPLYPASALDAVRRQALEEAAKVCGGLRHHNWSSESDDWIDGTERCADAIRALIKESSDDR